MTRKKDFRRESKTCAKDLENITIPDRGGILPSRKNIGWGASIGSTRIILLLLVSGYHYNTHNNERKTGYHK